MKATFLVLCCSFSIQHIFSFIVDHVHYNKRQISSSSLIKAIEKDNEDYYDDDDDEAEYNDLEVNVKNFKPPKTTSNPIMSFGLTQRSPGSERGAIGSSKNSMTSTYICTNCGTEYLKWRGKCNTCSQWNTIQEYRVKRSATKQQKLRPSFGKQSTMNGNNMKASTWLGDIDSGANQPVRLSDIMSDSNNGFRGNNFRRLMIPNNEELNNVFGGGLMPGSLTLLGGDPGVGKSTLLLQVAGDIASLSIPKRGIGMGLDESESKMNNNREKVGPVLYCSGEENAWQIASRASRLGIPMESEGLLVLCETDVDYISDIVVNNNVLPSLLIIDSIQTMICDSGGSSSAGGITQVRECVSTFLRLSKSTGVPIVMIGHVTKSGDVAGPKTVEHMVDTVLYLESDFSSNHGDVKILRASKNRFGSSDEVGVFESGEGGRVVQVNDPSSLFLSDRRAEKEDVEGCAVSLTLEGSRPVTAEIQALVSSKSSGFGAGAGGGKRTSDGISMSRLLLILAVLNKRVGLLSFSMSDVFVNVVGGIRFNTWNKSGAESDLATALALVSSFCQIKVRSDTIFFGEIGLTGELRPIGDSSYEKRVNEAKRMGFSRIVGPIQGKRIRKSKKKRSNPTTGTNSSSSGIQVIQCETLVEAINEGLVTKLPPTKRKRGRQSKQKNRKKRENDISPEFEVLDDDDDDYNMDMDLGLDFQ